MAESLLTKLFRERCPAWISLCFCLKDKIIILLQRTCHVAAKRNLCACQFILGWMINITTSYRQCLSCNFKMVICRLYTIRISTPLKIQIMCDKLIRAGILFYNIGLPGQKFGNQSTAELVKFSTKASIDGSTHIREIFPVIHTITPVIQTKRCIHGIGASVKFFLQIFHKCRLHIRACGIIIFCLIIQLETDDTFASLADFQQFTDYTLPIFQIIRICDIHDLTGAVHTLALMCHSQNCRIHFYQPGWNRIGWCTDDDVNACFFHGIQHLGHRGKIKLAFLLFVSTPGGFCDTDYIDACGFHHFDVFF